MAKTARISTPWLHQLDLLRVHALPSAVFVVCVVLTLWMWNRQAIVMTAPTGSQTISTSVKQMPSEPPSQAGEEEGPTDLDALTAS